MDRYYIPTRLQEEKARLEEARRLREEQMELKKQQELNNGLVNNAQLERQAQNSSTTGTTYRE
uniref:CCDC50_N domain-containing protein n=1 Tax=Loa loa TaxID=7209 RepID=A0A1I7VYL7_LOALO